MSTHDSTAEKSAPDLWRPAFLAALALTGNVSAAARAAQIDRTTAYLARANDTAFAEAWQAAKDEAVDALLAEARRRAVEGTRDPIYHQGIPVGEKVSYSDTLLIFLIKGERPEYRDNHRVELTGKDGGPVATTAAVTFYLPENGREERA